MEVERLVQGAGPSSVRVTKGQVAFRRWRAFAWVWTPGRWLKGGGRPWFSRSRSCARTGRNGGRRSSNLRHDGGCTTSRFGARTIWAMRWRRGSRRHGTRPARRRESVDGTDSGLYRRDHHSGWRLPVLDRQDAKGQQRGLSLPAPVTYLPKLHYGKRPVDHRGYVWEVPTQLTVLVRAHRVWKDASCTP